MKIYLALLCICVLLTGCSGSGTESSAKLENIYANGFRLVQVRSTLNFISDDRTRIRDYEYNMADQEVTITSIPADEDEEPSLSKLYLDRAGRLVGGSFDYTLGSFISGTRNYNISYDADGKVVNYRVSEFDNYTFNYVDELLDNIFHRLSNTEWTFRFTYDAQGQRTSSQDAVTLETTHFEYNAEGQLTNAVDIDQFGEQKFTYEFGYDTHGNLVSVLSYTPFGQLFSTDAYTYEFSDEPVFNHGIMRQAIEPYEATNASFVR